MGECVLFAENEQKRGITGQKYTFIFKKGTQTNVFWNPFGKMVPLKQGGVDW